MSYTDFIEQNIAPYSAEKIGVYDSSGNRVGIIPLGNFKPSYGNRLYRFGLLSDVHNQSDQSAESTEDLQRALAYFNEKESVEMTCICGDISQNGTASEFQIYKNNVDTKSPNTPVYTTVGNHDATTGGLNVNTWNTYTGNHGRCFEITKNNDHFLFFGMNKWSLGNSGTPYLDTDIDWLEEKLETYRNQRCFVFTHLFFPTRAGNLNNIYPSGNWLGGAQLTRIQALNDRYKNSIWFSGHSHWKWYLQKYQDRANIYKENCGWCVHVPSCASPIDSNGTSRDNKPLESEGAIVDVYENYIDIRGMNLKAGKYLPIAQYRLDTTLVNIDAKPSTTYSITNNLTNCTNSNNAISIEKNSSYSATITANDGYTINSITVTMGGNDVSSTVISGNVITISSVTGDIVIEVTTTRLITNYTITNNLTNATNSNTATNIEGNTSYSATITANDGYQISSVIVTMGGTDITSSAYSNGVLTISDVTGDIIITVIANPLKEEISITWEEGSLNSTTGLPESNSSHRRTQNISIDHSKTYSITLDDGNYNNALIRVVFFKNDDTVVSLIKQISADGSFDVPTDSDYMRLRIYKTYANDGIYSGRFHLFME